MVVSGLTTRCRALLAAPLRAAPLRAAPVLMAPVLWAAGAAAASAVLYAHDPHVPGAYGQCPFLRATGLPCPGCGGLRSVNDLTRGDLVGALSSNAYAVLSVAGLAGWWAAWVIARAKGRPAPLEGSVLRLVAVWAVGFLAFGLLRLIPALAWFQP